jgi:hypothetical protein
MRKVTEQASKAFMNDKAFKQGSTQVVVEENEVALFLHGHKIARKNTNTNVVEVNNCGYETNVTKERLNGVIGEVSSYSAQIYQQSFVWYWKSGEMFLPNRWMEV